MVPTLAHSDIYIYLYIQNIQNISNHHSYIYITFMHVFWRFQTCNYFREIFYIYIYIYIWYVRPFCKNCSESREIKTFFKYPKRILIFNLNSLSNDGMHNVSVNSKPDHPPGNFFERANSPLPGRKKVQNPCARKIVLKPHPRGNYFQKSSKKRKT